MPSQAALGKSQSPLNFLFLCLFTPLKSTPSIATDFLVTHGKWINSVFWVTCGYSCFIEEDENRNDLTKATVWINKKIAGFISVSAFPLEIWEKFMWTFSFHSVVIVECGYYSAALAWNLDKKLTTENTFESKNHTWQNASADKSELRWTHAPLSLIKSISKHPLRVSAYSFYSCFSLARCRKRCDFFLPPYYLWPKPAWFSFIVPLCTWILWKEVNDCNLTSCWNCADWQEEGWSNFYLCPLSLSLALPLVTNLETIMTFSLYWCLIFWCKGDFFGVLF